MRFLHLINVRWYNATAWYAVNISRLLRDNGHEVIVAGLPGSPPLQQAEAYGLKTFEAPFNSNNPVEIKRMIQSVNQLMKTFSPDVVNCHRGEFYWYFASLKLFRDPSWKLIRVRGDIRPPSSDFINRFLHSKPTDKVITSGQVIKNYYTDNLKLIDSHVDVIHGGVDTTVFFPDSKGRDHVRNEFQFNDDDFVVGIVGRFDHVKGHSVVIEAVSKLYHSDMKNIRLFLIGFDTTINTDEITALIQQADVESICHISGFRDDINACINALDLGIIASLGSEAICRVAMELMAANVPVVSSDVGVLPEIVPTENIYERGNSDALADKIKNHSKEILMYSDEQFYDQYMKSVTDFF